MLKMVPVWTVVGKPAAGTGRGSSGLWSPVCFLLIDFWVFVGCYVFHFSLLTLVSSVLLCSQQKRRERTWRERERELRLVYMILIGEKCDKL